MECIVSLLRYHMVIRAEFKTYSKIHEVNSWNNLGKIKADPLYMHVGDRAMCILCVMKH